MRRLLPLLALAPLLTGCIGAGVTAHRTAAFNRYFETYNERNASLLKTPHAGVSTLTGQEYTLWLFPGAFGLGQATLRGSSTATFNNGGTHTVDVSAKDFLIQSGYPVASGMPMADAVYNARMTVNAHVDLHFRETSAVLTQVNGGASAGQTQAVGFRGSAMGARPGVSLNLNFNPGAQVNVRARAFLGYDIPVFENETLAYNYINYLGQEYGVSSITTDESKGIKANLNGFTGSVGIIVGFGAGF